MRLDVFLTENGYVSSRTEAKHFISDGAVKIDGRIITKPAFDIDESSNVEIDKSSKKYVSRGGLKLEAALEAFGVSAEGKSAVDIGASSGGFTDCLLKHGAARVIAVDSGTAQLVSSLREDSRVICVENYNARYMKIDDLAFIPELAVMDVSFISATYIIKSIFECLSDDGEFICLIKPQFEVGRANIGKGGIVKNEKVREAAKRDVIAFAESIGFKFIGSITSPIVGGDGNTEYLAYFRK